MASARPATRRCWTVAGPDPAPYGQFKGSYAKLVDFLRECHSGGCKALNDDRFADLLRAVEDLSNQGGRSHAVNLGSIHSDAALKTEEVLESWGIKLEPDDEDGNVLRFPSLERLEEEQQRPPLRSRTAPAKFCWPQQGDCLNEDDMLNREVSSSSCVATDLAPVPLEFNVLETSARRVQHMDSKGSTPILRDAALLGRALVTPFNILERFSISAHILRAWIAAIGNQYLGNPYHNWSHAMDVFFFAYFALTQGGGQKYFNIQDILALLTAAIAHDVGHFGMNNAFLIKTGAQLALVYNDMSPLENMHASTYFKTLAQKGMDFTSHWSTTERNCIRSKVVEAILSTDMAHHFSFVDRFSARLSEAFDSMSDLINDPVASRPDRRMLLQAFLHMADLGHTTRLWELHKVQVVALEEEIFLQGDRERELGVPIMPMMDRTKDSLAVGQGAFLDVMVRPLLTPFARLLSSEVNASMMRILEDNRQGWDALVAKYGKKTAAEIVELDAANEHANAKCRKARSQIVI